MNYNGAASLEQSDRRNRQNQNFNDDNLLGLDRNTIMEEAGDDFEQQLIPISMSEQ